MVRAAAKAPALAELLKGHLIQQLLGPGLDSLLSIVQMPKGIPVATFAIGEAGAANAGLFAVALLAGRDPKLAARLAKFRKKQTVKAKAMKLPKA